MTAQSGRRHQLSDAGNSAFAVVGVGRVLRQQCGGLLTVAALSSRTAASCSGELTLPTLCCRSTWRRLYGRFKGATVVRAVVSVGKRPANEAIQLPRDVLLANGRLREIRMPLADSLSQLFMATAKQF
jgi:hypothetical protein